MFGIHVTEKVNSQQML